MKNVSDSSPSTEKTVVLVSVSIIIPIGLIGNIFSIVVLCQKQFRNNIPSIFLVALAISDSVYLLTNSQTTEWLRYVSGVDVKRSSNVSCKLLTYIIYVAKAYGSWIIVTLNFERLLLVALPFKANSYMTLRRAKVVIVGILISILVIYSYELFITAIQKKELHTECALSDENTSLLKGLTIFNLLFDSLLPAFCILTSNGLLYYILRFKRKSRLLDNDTLGLAATLIVISITYIGLTLPFSILLVLDAHIFPKHYSRVFYSGFYAMDLLNSAINFALYCLSGSVFRSELRRILFQHTCKDNRVHQIS